MNCRPSFASYWIHSLLIALVGLSLPSTAGRGSPEEGRRLQEVVDRVMVGRVGTAVVLDAVSGRILAEYRPDIAARRLAHPGSALKPFTLLALLEQGELDPETTILCRRHVRLDGRSLDCSHARTSRPLDAVSALAYSCNYFFAHFARQLDSMKFTQTDR